MLCRVWTVRQSLSYCVRMTTRPVIGKWYRSTIDPAVRGQVTEIEGNMVRVRIAYGGEDACTKREFDDSWEVDR
jgi:hypothetical protein